MSTPFSHQNKSVVEEGPERNDAPTPAQRKATIQAHDLSALGDASSHDAGPASVPSQPEGWKLPLPGECETRACCPLHQRVPQASHIHPSLMPLALAQPWPVTSPPLRRATSMTPHLQGQEAPHSSSLILPGTENQVHTRHRPGVGRPRPCRAPRPCLSSSCRPRGPGLSSTVTAGPQPPPGGRLWGPGKLSSGGGGCVRLHSASRPGTAAALLAHPGCSGHPPPPSAAALGKSHVGRPGLAAMKSLSSSPRREVGGEGTCWEANGVLLREVLTAWLRPVAALSRGGDLIPALATDSMTGPGHMRGGAGGGTSGPIGICWHKLAVATPDPLWLHREWGTGGSSGTRLGGTGNLGGLPTGL